MMKHWKLCLAVSACLVMTAFLAACSGSGGSDNPENSDTDPGSDDGAKQEYVVTDVDFGDSQVHEELERLEFEPGETVDSVYYKRTTDPETNTAAYLVKRSSDGEEQYLPLSKTVCYVDEMLADRAYYERVPLQYMQDGEQIETYQYQIYTSAFAPGSDGSRYAEAQNHEAADIEEPDAPAPEASE